MNEAAYPERLRTEEEEVDHQFRLRVGFYEMVSKNPSLRDTFRRAMEKSNTMNARVEERFQKWLAEGGDATGQGGSDNAK